MGGSLSPDSCSLCPLHLLYLNVAHPLLALTDASWNALTDPYVLLVVLLSLVVNTIPSLTVHLYCTITGKTTIQQVRAARGLAWGGVCLLPASVSGAGQGAAGGGKGEVPQRSHCLDCSGGTRHLSLVAPLSSWWSLMTLVPKPDSRALSPNWFMA